MKAQLLQLIKDVPVRKEDVMRAVISSGLMPEEILSQWLNNAVKQRIETAQALQGLAIKIPWHDWADKWLSGEDRTAQSAKVAAQEAQRIRDSKVSNVFVGWNEIASAWAAYEAAHRHPSIIDCLCSNTETHEVIREQLYNDMMKVINEIGE